MSLAKKLKSKSIKNWSMKLKKKNNLKSFAKQKKKN